MPNCKSCGAVINFQRTETGALMPINPKLRTIITRQGQTVQGFEVHWTTCPQADQHRKREGKFIEKRENNERKRHE